LFLSIEHTGMVVGNTVARLKFYRVELGLRFAGESLNYGPEQEHLNNVFGARLHISGLATPQPGINVEFLEYLAPTDGRPYPQDSNSNDLWHWQTSFESNGLDATFASTNPAFISSGTVLFRSPALGFTRASIVRDPDGHAVRLIER